MIDIITAIHAINPDAGCSISAEDINRIKWWNGVTPIPNEDILAKQAELQIEYDALTYARARGAAYPELKEFAEAYCEKEIGEDSTKWDAYVTKYNLVRSNNPKP